MMICLQHIALLSRLLPPGKKRKSLYAGHVTPHTPYGYMSTTIVLLQVLALTRGR